MWRLYFFMKNSVSFTLHSWLASNQKMSTSVSFRAKITTPVTYPQVVNYLLQTYATDKNVDNAEDEISTFYPLLRKTTVQYAEELIGRTLQCGDVCEEEDLKKIFISVLNKFIRHSMPGYWSSKTSATLKGLAFHTTSSQQFQGGDQPSAQLNQINNKN